MAWIYLILAGLLEIGWPVGLKMAQQTETRIIGIVIAIVFMGVSGFLLWMAQKAFLSEHLMQYGRESVQLELFL